MEYLNMFDIQDFFYASIFPLRTYKWLFSLGVKGLLSCLKTLLKQLKIPLQMLSSPLLNHLLNNKII